CRTRCQLLAAASLGDDRAREGPLDLPADLRRRRTCRRIRRTARARRPRAARSAARHRPTELRSPAMSVFKAAVVQMRSGTEPRRNAAGMEAMVREAVARGASYVQTPEMTGALV